MTLFGIFEHSASVLHKQLLFYASAQIQEPRTERGKRKKKKANRKREPQPKMSAL